MRKMIVEKYVDQTLDETYTVPVAFIGILTKFLPSSAMAGLTQNGFNLDAIMNANAKNQAHKTEVMVEEKGIMKRVVITLALE